MPFQSQAQWRWAFATNQPFAREWAKMTPGGKRAFLMLAKRVGTKAAMDSYAVAHKHLPGKHDQSSHGRQGRGGGGGGALGAMRDDYDALSTSLQSMGAQGSWNASGEARKLVTAHTTKVAQTLSHLPADEQTQMLDEMQSVDMRDPVHIQATMTLSMYGATEDIRLRAGDMLKSVNQDAYENMYQYSYKPSAWDSNDTGQGRVRTIADQQKTPRQFFEQNSIDYMVRTDPDGFSRRMWEIHAEGKPHVHPVALAGMAELMTYVGPNAEVGKPVHSFYPEGVKAPAPNPKAISLMNAHYDRTQEALKSLYIDSVNVFRGGAMEPGATVEPWSISKMQASEWAMRGETTQGVYMLRESVIPARYILNWWGNPNERTQYGNPAIYSESEQEFTIAGLGYLASSSYKKEQVTRRTKKSFESETQVISKSESLENLVIPWFDYLAKYRIWKNKRMMMRTKAAMDSYAVAHKHLPGKHDQSAHGRRGAVGGAFRAAYTAARAEGKPHNEAWNAGKTAAEGVREQMRVEKRAAEQANYKTQHQILLEKQNKQIEQTNVGLLQDQTAIYDVIRNNLSNKNLTEEQALNFIIDDLTKRGIGYNLSRPPISTDLMSDLHGAIEMGKKHQKLVKIASEMSDKLDDAINAGANSSTIEKMQNELNLYKDKIVNDALYHTKTLINDALLKHEAERPGSKKQITPQIDWAGNTIVPGKTTIEKRRGEIIDVTPTSNRKKMYSQMQNFENTTHKHLPGKHDQSSHGRKGRAGQAFRAAYTSARADGKTHHQALQEGKQASSAVRDAARAERASAATTATTARKPVARVASDGGIGLTGTTTTAFGNDPRTRYQLKHRIVEMDEVIPSNLDSGAINPRYDASLQPRQRERDASIAQIDRLAREMDTDAMTGDFYRIDFGSPIIDSNGNVLSGNGRTMALLAQRGSQYGDKSAEYRAQVERQAAELGIDPAQVARMRHPMIVRELVDTRITPQEFAHEANTSQTLRMSPKEQAVADARKIGLSMIERLPRDVEGVSVDQLLRGSAGRPFVDAWLATVPENERAGLLTANGGLNPIGLYRAKAALYTHAFPSESGQRMATSLLDSLEPDLATVQSGLSGALPHLSTAISRARSGQIDRSLDVSDDLATAIDAVARIRDLPLLERVPTRKRVETFLRQTNMFTEDGKSGLNPVQEALTRHIDRIASSQSAVRDFLDDLSARINAQPAAGQSSLFGGEEPLTLMQIVDGAIASSQAKLKPAKTRKPKQATEGKPAK